MKSLASDNYAGVLPEVMQALAIANQYHAPSYGADEVTKRVTAKIQQLFNCPDATVLFVFNGTGANVLSLIAGTRSFNAVLCADTSHIYNDESSAPETITGCRYFALPANENGQLTPAIVRKRLIRKGDMHYAQPKILSITQSTEYGTVYRPEEINALATLAKEEGLYLHMDGSRYWNAAASLGCALSTISHDAGVDILSLGGTKIGMMFGEAVIVFNKELAREIKFHQKQVMQLASKTRFIAAQFEALLTDELWRKTALHANQMATLLASHLAQIPEIKITKPTEANVVFAEIPIHWNEPLMNVMPFYVWLEERNEVRLMCAWDTTEAEILNFVAAVNKLR